MSDKFWFLKRCDLFERLTAEHLQRLEARARIRKFPRNSPIYFPSDAADGVLVLAEGRVRICDFTADGKQAILAFIEPGELFGEWALLDSPKREEYAEAVEPSTVVLLPTDVVQRLIDDVPQVSVGLTRLIGLRRRRIECRLKSLLFRSNRERLIHLLLDLAEQYGRTDTDGVLIDIKLSHQDLANIIGSTRETVTVTLGELAAEGLLRVARKTIVVANLDRLANTVGATAPPLKLAPRQPSEIAPAVANPLYKPRPSR